MNLFGMLLDPDGELSVCLWCCRLILVPSEKQDTGKRWEWLGSGPRSSKVGFTDEYHEIDITLIKYKIDK